MPFARNEWQKEYRIKNKNVHTKVYEKSIKGFLVRSYRNMQSRVDGVQIQKHHLYKDKELMPREDFYGFAMGSAEFYELFGKYKESGWSRKLCPSPDRKDSKLGYAIDNLEWVTMSENSRRGTMNRWSKA